MNVLLMDLDDTLIQTSRWKRALFMELAHVVGVHPAYIYATYEELKHQGTPAGWHHAFARKLIPDKPYIIEERLFDSLNSIRIQYSVLHYALSFHGKKIIFTFGDEEVQMAKIHALHIRDYFDDVMVMHYQKIDRIRHIEKEYSTITVVDDDRELLHRIKMQFPHIRVISASDFHEPSFLFSV